MQKKKVAKKKARKRRTKTLDLQFVSVRLPAEQLAYITELAILCQLPVEAVARVILVVGVMRARAEIAKDK
jgi:hypothetical protein